MLVFWVSFRFNPSILLRGCHLAEPDCRLISPQAISALRHASRRSRWRGFYSETDAGRRPARQLASRMRRAGEGAWDCAI